MTYGEKVKYLDQMLRIFAPLNEIFAGLYKVWTVSTTKSDRLISFCFDCIAQAEILLKQEDYDNSQVHQQRILQEIHRQEQKEKDQFSDEALLAEL